MEKEKKLEEMSVIELKAVCFDLDNEIKLRQSQLSQVYKVLQDKFKEEQNKKVEVNKDGINKK